MAVFTAATGLGDGHPHVIEKPEPRLVPAVCLSMTRDKNNHRDNRGREYGSHASPSRQKAPRRVVA